MFAIVLELLFTSFSAILVLSYFPIPSEIQSTLLDLRVPEVYAQSPPTPTLPPHHMHTHILFLFTYLSPNI